MIFRIVIPSVVFSAIEFFPSCLIQGRGIDMGYALYKTIGGGTYWFTSALVVAELILLMLFCTRKRNIWFYAVVCLVIGMTGLTIVHLDILKSGIWAWRQGLIALVFLAMGGLYWKYEDKFRVQRSEFSVESSSKANVGKRSRMLRILSSLLLAASYVASVVLLKDYNDPLISTLTIQPLGFVTSAMACLLLVWLCKKLPEVKPLTFIGQNSLGFYFMSGALPITFSMIAHKVLSGNSVWVMLAIWISCLVTAYLALKLINRWLPWLWDLRLWGKG